MPKPSACPPRELLRDVILGRVALTEAESVVSHLENCAACQTSLQGLEAQDTLVLSLARPPLSVTDEGPVLDRLVEQVARLAVPAEPDYDSVLERGENPNELGRLGPYRVKRLLGAGGMGLVFEAEEVPLGRHVALKLIKPSLVSHPAIRRRFLREARAVALIEHERIVSIYRVGEEQGVPFMAMQLLKGRTLEKHLREQEQAGGERALNIADAVKIARQIAEGLTAAHAHGVIHRDVKPGNIFLQGPPPFAVKLLDFGLARAVDDELNLTDPGGTGGTPAYAAPEQFAGHSIDTRCDLYGLGCTLYRMVVGQTPLAVSCSTIMLSAARRRIVAPHDFNGEISTELSDLIVALLADDPSNRPHSAQDVVVRLTEIEGHVQATLNSTPMPLPSCQSAPKQGRRTALASAAAAMVFAVAYVINSRLPETEHVPTDPRDEWSIMVAGLPPDQQLKAVVDQLKHANPGFDGHVGSRVEEGRVVELRLITDFVTDLKPLRALAGLETLACRGSETGKGRLADLSSLAALKSLSRLDISANQVADLSPLHGMPLTELTAPENPIEDLRPLAGMPLDVLDLNFTFVSDLSPLENASLTRLLVRNPYAIDFLPLERLPLTEIQCDFRPNRHAKNLRAIRSLQTINGIPAGDFWWACDARRRSMKEWLPRASRLPPEQQLTAVAEKLRELNPQFNDKLYPTMENGHVVELRLSVDQVTDLGPLRAVKTLKRLKVFGTGPGAGRLFDLDPVRDLPLTVLDCSNTQVGELSALRRMPLATLVCQATPVRDLVGMRTLPLRYLDCRASRVIDLAPLQGTKIAYLDVTNCGITDFSPLKDLPLEWLFLSIDQRPSADALRSMATLQEINGEPAADFWQSPPP